MGKLQKLLLGISDAEAGFQRRGFYCSGNRIQQRLELVGVTFLRGYHAALETSEPRPLQERLLEVEPEIRGFAFEGAGMALGLLDYLTPWKKNRFQRFLLGPGAPHRYMLHVGLGWAWARLPLSTSRAITTLDPLIGWLAFDGYGFHEGYFNWRKYKSGLVRHPRGIKGDSATVFDQGLGRSLWFVEGADIERIARAISALDSDRHPDLWSGVGLACAYAGGLDLPALLELRALAGPFGDKLAQGAAFAAKARQHAGNAAAHTELACRMICGMTADEAAAVTDRALRVLSYDRGQSPYEIWRHRIQAEFAEELAESPAIAAGAPAH